MLPKDAKRSKNHKKCTCFVSSKTQSSYLQMILRKVILSNHNLLKVMK